MRIQYFLIFVAITTFSCKKNLGNLISENDIVPQNKILQKELEHINGVGDIDFTQFLPVYRISKNSYGVIINLTDSNNQNIQQLRSKILDSTLNLYFSKTYNDYLELADTTGNLTLFKNKIVSTQFDSFINSSYSLYCHDTIFSSKITDILFHPDECITSFILLRFEKDSIPDRTPLFASKFQVPLVFGDYSNVTKEINKKLSSSFIRLMNDSISNIFASYMGNYFFGYNEDFNRGLRKQKDYYSDLGVPFPSRFIVKKQDSKIVILNSHELDLFGLPCD